MSEPMKPMEIEQRSFEIINAVRSCCLGAGAEAAHEVDVDEQFG